jgi:hypothetical protein
MQSLPVPISPFPRPTKTGDGLSRGGIRSTPAGHRRGGGREAGNGGEGELLSTGLERASVLRGRLFCRTVIVP